MYLKLRDTEEEMAVQANYTKVPAAIREPDIIEMLLQADGIYRLDHDEAGTWKSILKAFAIDADQVKRKAKQNGSQPNAGAHTVKIKTGR